MSMIMRRVLAGAAATLVLGCATAHERGRYDPVLEWNRITFEHALNEQPPPEQIRFAAILHLAVFEGVNAVTRDYESTLGTINAPDGASASAAAVGAAHKVLTTYFPDKAAVFDAEREKSLRRISHKRGRRAGLEVGEAAATAVMASRQNDGSELSEFYIPQSNAPGEWQLTAGCPPNGGVYLHWSKVKTFIIPDPKQFRSAPPPRLNSAEYARAFNEVSVMGARDSTQRPADRTMVARFYNTYGDAALWNPIARQLARANRQTLSENARLFALINMGMHDLAVALVETKYHHHFWRPETAIPAAGSDGNDATVPNASYQPLVETPCHPSYGSGHAATSGEPREILRRAFGEGDHHIVVSNPQFPGVVYRYAELGQITRDIDDARVFGGIHYRFDQAAGAEQGRRVGEYVWRHGLKPVATARGQR
jgi:hypothetical protein